jgi:hypothetical protein
VVSTLNLLDVVALLMGVILLLKRVANMDRYHTLRVVVLTSILSCLVIWFFFGYGFSLGNPHKFDDCLDFGSKLSETEM